MSTKTILIAESGSTKTDWYLFQSGKNKNFKTQGINPYFLNDEEIFSILKNELKINPSKISIDEMYFYGAGINLPQNQKRLEHLLKNYFNLKKVYAESDLVAAARGTCQHTKGIVCILGTGSNSCLYNGKKISYKTSSLGYVLGDEGSGNHLGKKVLQYYFHDIFDNDLKEKFNLKYESQLQDVLQNIYQKSFPNRYLATFASFIFENRGHFMIENIAEDCLNDFFINHLLRYPQVHKLPIHFTGSVAFYLKDILLNLCEQYEIQCSSIIQSPLKKLIQYHTQSLK